MGVKKLFSADEAVVYKIRLVRFLKSYVRKCAPVS
jgi:hypothetical protein